MKTCPECRKPVTVSLLYCTTCGADVSKPAKTRRERLLLVLSPYFMILAAIALSVELGVIDAVDNGMAYGGALAMVYLFTALLFWLMTKVFKSPALPESYWQAGLLSTVDLVACTLLAFVISEVFANESIMNVGPQNYHYSILEILVVVYLPVLFAGLLAVSARARVTRFPDSAAQPSLQFFFKHAVVLIPVALTLLIVVLDLAQPPAGRAMIRARVLYEMQAADLAMQTVDDALTVDDSFAPLHFMKGIVILDYASGKYGPADAVKHLERANELKPKVPTWLFCLSMAYDREKKGPAAIAAATEAGNLLPNDPYLWQYLGDLNMKYKNGRAAVQAYKTALQISPDDPLLLNNLAFTMLELGMELPEALEMAKMSAELLPGRIFNLDTLAWAYYKNAQYAEALEIMSDIYSGRSEVSPEIDFHYAMILQAMGMLSNPIETFDKLLARPEIAADHNFFQQVYQARRQAETTASDTSATEDAGFDDARSIESSDELHKDDVTADKSPEPAEQNSSADNAELESEVSHDAGEPSDEE